MRNFEERKAEVFRRSENRIKERKRNRNRILAMCIPLCLVLTIFSVVMIPGMLPVGTDNAENENIGFVSDGTADEDGAADGAVGSLDDSKTHNYVSVTVKDGDYSNKFTEASSVNNVFHNIYEILEANGGYQDITNQSGTGTGDNVEDATDATAKVGCIIITMTSVDGTERVFLLDDLTLYDQAFKKEITLTTAQHNDLLVALELADY